MNALGTRGRLTVADPPLLAPAPLCVLCIGTRTDEGRTCPRCHGTGKDPDPEAPVLAS